MKNIICIVILFFGALAQSAETNNLTREVAQERFERLSNIQYKFEFEFSNDQKDYSGKEQIRFTLKKDADKPLRLDFLNGHIDKLSLNSKTQSVTYDNSNITLAPTDLKAGENVVDIIFTHPYNTTGTGLTRFKDPEDGRIYLHTKFETFYANQMFPCFDQPDLKATYSLQVTAPHDWLVTSSVPESSAGAQGENRKLWIFPQSPKFSTYLFSVHAGPYKMWESKAGKIPMRLFARQSFAKYVDEKEWFLITKQGLNFYGKYFDFPYPFAKYDQVIAPDFSSGAMENVADVTFSESLIKRGKPTRDDRAFLADVILHEMAHMWFGDLVTMKWWNDLWLNESFATYMASVASQQATQFKEPWIDFFATDKRRAYVEDQLVTTHPIEGIVTDTNQAIAIFDAISYGKGASAVKQLFYLLGAHESQKGIQKYFKKFQYSNAVLDDFVASLEEHPGDLNDWKKSWLQTAGVNTLEAKFDCKKGKINSFFVEQSAPSDLPYLRLHRTEIGLFKKAHEKIVLSKTVSAKYSGPRQEIPELIGEACPAMVYPNYGDFDYVKVKLDEKTLGSVKEDIAGIKDPLTRLMIWASLWDMVRDGQLKIQTYANLVFDLLPNETEFKILDSVLDTIHGRVGDSFALYYWPAGAELDAYKKKLEDFLWTQTKTSKPGSDLQKRWFDGFVKVAQSPDELQRLAAILGEKTTLPQFPIDQDRRWNIVYQLNKMDPKIGDPLLQAETLKDPSNSGILMAISSQAGKPQEAAKREWFNKIISTQPELPYSQQGAVIRALLPSEQKEFRSLFADDFFKNLPQVVKTKSDRFQAVYASRLAPATCTDQSVKRLGTYLASESGLTPIALKNLKIAHQEDARCVKIQQLATESEQKRH